MTVESAPASFETPRPAGSALRARFLRAPVLIPAVVIVVAAIYLVYTAIASTAVYYLTVSELKAAGPTVYNQSVRVAGNVVPGSIQRDPTSFEVHFQAE